MSPLFRSILLPLVCVPSVSTGQAPDPLVNGQRIRVVSRCDLARDQVPTCGASSLRWTYTGQLEGHDHDNLRFREQSTKAELVIPTASITSLSVADGTRGHFLEGAEIGVVGGALIGFALASASSNSGDFIPPDASKFLGVVAGMPAGFLLGGIVGAAIRSDRWRLVSLNDQRVRVTPRLDTRGLGFGVTVPF